MADQRPMPESSSSPPPSGRPGPVCVRRDVDDDACDPVRTGAIFRCDIAVLRGGHVGPPRGGPHVAATVPGGPTPGGPSVSKRSKSHGGKPGKKQQGPSSSGLTRAEDAAIAAEFAALIDSTRAPAAVARGSSDSGSSPRQRKDAASPSSSNKASPAQTRRRRRAPEAAPTPISARKKRPRASTPDDHRDMLPAQADGDRRAEHTSAIGTPTERASSEQQRQQRTAERAVVPERAEETAERDDDDDDDPVDAPPGPFSPPRKRCSPEKNNSRVAALDSRTGADGGVLFSDAAASRTTPTRAGKDDTGGLVKTTRSGRKTFRVLDWWKSERVVVDADGTANVVAGCASPRSSSGGGRLRKARPARSPRSSGPAASSSKETACVPAASEETTSGPASSKETTSGPAESKETTSGPATEETTPGPAVSKETTSGSAAKETTSGPAVSRETTPGPAVSKETTPGPAPEETTEISRGGAGAAPQEVPQGAERAPEGGDGRGSSEERPPPLSP